jgi:hypothetical protein
MPEGTECVQRDGCEGRADSAAKAGRRGSEGWQRSGGTARKRRVATKRREGSDGRAATKGRLPRGRSRRFQTPRSASLLKGISYKGKNYSRTYDKSPKINSLVGML